MEIIGYLTVNYGDKVLSLSDVPVDISVKQFKRTLLYKLELPELDRTGNEIPYFLIIKRTGRYLVGNTTLAENNLQDDDELEFADDDISKNDLPSQREKKSAELIKIKEKKDALEIADRLGDKLLQTINDSSVRKDEQSKAVIGIDKNILLVFSIAFLGSLFFSFYLIIIGRLDAVTAITYPIISVVIGFLSGYFAGTGRTQGRK